MSDFLDQTPLLELAERLVAAARRAGADAADAVAVRSISLSVEVRDGAVEESERAEGDDMGLRVLVGRRQAVVSTNDVRGNGADALAERAVAMARAAPEDQYAGLADANAARARISRSRPDRPGTAGRRARSNGSARAAERAGLAVKGVSKSGGASASAGIGGMVLVTSHGFRGAYVGSRHSMSMVAIAGEGTGMERDYDFSSALHAGDLEAPEKIGRVAGERAVKRLNPRKVETRRVPVVFDPRVAEHAGRASRLGDQRRLDRAQDELPEGPHGRAAVPPRHPHRRRSAAQARIALASLRRRRRRRQAARRDRRRRAQVVVSRLRRPRANLSLATTGHAARGVSSSPSPSPTNLHLEAGSQSREELIADIEDGFYVTDLIGMGTNLVTGDYSRGASGLWIEKGELTYPVSEVTIAGHLNDIFASLTPANDLEFRYGTNAPTVRLEGLTVAGT